jgi:hypothetical protein
LVYGRGFFCHELANVDRRIIDLNAVGFSSVGGEMKHFGGMQEGFARDAANVQAGAAQVFVFFNQGGFESELSGANRGDVATGSGSDYNAIKSAIC